MDTARDTDTYDAGGNRLSWCDEQWSNDQWVGIDRYTFTFDAHGNWLSCVVALWQNNQWVDCGRQTYTYDSHDERLSVSFENLTGNQGFQAYLLTFTYDASEHQTSSLETVSWDGVWSKADTSATAYDAYGYPTSFYYAYMSNNEWMTSYLFRGTNDSMGHQLGNWEQFWSDGQPTITQRDTMTYDAHGNLTSDVTQQLTNGQWVNVERQIDNYTEKGAWDSFQEENWVNNGWMISRRLSETFDGNGKAHAWLYESTDAGSFGNTSLFIFSYDREANLNSFSNFAWTDSGWTPADENAEEFQFSVVDSAGNFYDLPECYYARFTPRRVVTEIESLTSSALPAFYLLDNYPNPFNPSTNIRYGLPSRTAVTLQVFNILGQTVATLVHGIEEAGLHDVTFDGSNLASGVYFYCIQAGKSVQTKRMILLR